MKKYKKILNVEEISSTNAHLFSLLNAENALNISIVTAEFQTAGKGQQGNSWHSARGENLLFSHVVFPQQLAAVEQFVISQIVALALCKTLQSFGIESCIKWANDIYVGNKKIAGVLIENQLSGNLVKTCIVGIGLNVNQMEFPHGLPNPISMAQCVQKNFDRNEVLELYLQNFESAFSDFENQNISRNAIANDYKRNLFRFQIPARFSDSAGEFEGVITDVKNDGKLVVQGTNGRNQEYHFKEIAFLI